MTVSMPQGELAQKLDVVYARLDVHFARRLAALHALMLSNDVLPALGDEFLVNYYRHVLGSGQHPVIGVLSGEDVVGFCQLSLSPMTLGEILSPSFSALWRVFWLALTKPRVFFLGMCLSNPWTGDADRAAEVSFIAVRHDMQGRGVGRELIRRATQCASDNGIATVVTRTSNEVAKAMYEKWFAAQCVEHRCCFGRTYWYLLWKS